MLLFGSLLIPFGVFLVLLGLAHDGIVTTMPTSIGGALTWGGIGSAGLGFVILAVEFAVGLARLWAILARHFGI